MENEFDKWNKLKKDTQSKTKIKHPKPCEIWWCIVGYNIGSEIYGKGLHYTRPVLIINSENADLAIAIPLSSKLKKSKFVKIITSDIGKHAAHVHQIKAIDKKRLGEKIGEISKEEFAKLKRTFDSLYKIL